MKYFLSVALSVFYIFSFSQNCSNITTVLTNDGICDNNDFVLVFEDYFDGGVINQNNWTPILGVPRDLDHAHEKQWYSPNNVVLNNGILSLEAKEEILLNQCFDAWNGSQMQSYCQDFDYTSGEIDSKFLFGYGKFEIRCKLPSGKGFWPAFWTFGVENGISGEIDCFEFWDNSTSNQGTNVHKNNTEECQQHINGVDFSQNYHTFTVQWDRNVIYWFVDGVQIRVLFQFTTLLGQNVSCAGLQSGNTYILKKGFPSASYMNIIANLALQYNSVYAPDATTPFPSALEVDYIKYYQRKPCYTNSAYTNNSQLDLSSSIYHSIVADNIQIGGDITISTNQQLKAIACQKIVLTPGFSAQSGSFFETRLDENICCSSRDVLPLSTDAIDEKLTYIKNPQPIEMDWSFDIIPNPSTGIFELSFFNNRSQLSPCLYTILIIDRMGEVVQKVVTSHEELLFTKIDLTAFPKGMYLVKVSNEISVKTKKIIIN